MTNKSTLLLKLMILSFLFICFFLMSSAFGQSITLTVSSGDGSSNNTTSISGTGFTPSPPDIAANSITFSGYSTTHAAITVDGSGNFPATALTLPALPHGDQTIIVQGQSFTGKYSVYRVITLVPSSNNGDAGNSFLISGTGFADTAISSNSVQVGVTATTHAGFTPSQGTFSNVTINLLALTSGFKDVIVQGETFSNAYRVSDISLTPDNGDGTAGNTTNISGTFFTPSSTISANSITVGGLSTTHALINVNVSGTFPATTVTLSALSSGLKDVVVDGITFDNYYRVPNIILSSSSDNGAAGNTTNISGAGFSPSSTIPANSITIGGRSTVHNLINVNSSGNFSATTVTLSALSYGSKDVIVDSITYTGRYSVYRNITLTPDHGDGTNGNTFNITGTGFQDSAISSNSITVGGLGTTHSGITPSNGTFTLLNVGLPALGYGSHDVVVQGQSFNYAYRVPHITVSPNTGDGNSGTTTSINGVGFVPGTISSNSITVGGRSTTHSSRTVGSNGVFSAVTVNLPYLHQGSHDVVVQGETFTNYYTVSADINLVNGWGNGTANNTFKLYGYGFPANQPIGINSITVGGQATTHSATTASANGDFTINTVTLPALTKGYKDVIAGGQTFVNYYYVYAEISFVTWGSNGAAGATDTISGTGFTPSTVPANSITIAGFATTHSSITIAADGTLPSTLLTLPDLPKGWQDVNVDDSDPGVETFSSYYLINSDVGTLSVTTGNGNTGNTTQITVGTGFSPGTITANTITFRYPGYSQQTVTHAAITVNAQGRIQGTPITLTLPYLPGGSLTLRVQGVDFTDAYVVTPSTITFTPSSGNGLNSDTTQVSGYGFTPSHIHYNSIILGGITLSHGNISVGANGIINTGDPDSHLALPYLSYGSKAAVVQGHTFNNAYNVNRLIVANPNTGNGLAGNTTSFTFSGFSGPATITSGSMTINGSPITHSSSISIPSHGYRANQQVTLPALPLGTFNVVAQSDTIVGVYTVQSDIYVKPSGGYGFEGLDVIINGTGFTPGIITANSIKFHGYSTTHSAITVAADGILPETTIFLPWLPYGMAPIDIKGDIFNDEYEVWAAAYLEPHLGSRNAGTILRLNGFGLIPGTIPANSIKLKHSSGGQITTTTHPAITVYATGKISETQIQVNSYMPWGWHDMIITDNSHDFTFYNVYGAGIQTTDTPSLSELALFTLLLLMGLLLLITNRIERKKSLSLEDILKK